MNLKSYISLFISLSYILIGVLSEIIIPNAEYRSPKNIAFSTVGGGSSHHIWVFEILKEMHNRGHSISFYSKGDQLRFADQYPMIKTKEAGGSTDFVHHPMVKQSLSTFPAPEKISLLAVEVCLLEYPLAFIELQDLFKKDDIDLVICDSFSIACIDAAIVSKLPVIITTTMGTFADFDATYINSKFYNSARQTIQGESLWTRIYRDFFRIPLTLHMISRRVKYTHKFQQNMGLEPIIDSSTKRYNGIPKLMNNVFGIETARKHSPLLHMIGPILRFSYPSLDKDLDTFLSNRTKVAYVAFGQHVLPLNRDVQLIMTNLLRLLEEKIIDGIIWANFNLTQVPESVITDDQKYFDSDILHHKDIKLMGWVSQYAILKHSSTSFFFSHGGAGSLHEALYNGVRLFVYPFFGDQPGNAIAIERIGVGKHINTINQQHKEETYRKMYRELYELAVDAQDKIRKATDRYRAYMQVRSVHAVTRGADYMEESLFASDDEGNLYYRNDVGYEIHWIKRNNVDIYAVFTAVGLIVLKFTSVMYNLSQKNGSALKKVKRT